MKTTRHEDYTVVVVDVEPTRSQLITESIFQALAGSNLISC